VLRICPKTKRWWDEELTAAIREARATRCIARVNPTDANIERATADSSAYFKLVFIKKGDHWNKYVQSVRGKAIWKAYRYCKPSVCRGVMPPLQRADGSLAQTREEKEEALLEGIYPKILPSARPAPSVSYTGSWPKVEEDEAARAINTLTNQKAPGPDGIKAQAIKEAWRVEEFKQYALALFRACVENGYHPRSWR
jgi:hypothetical protein